MATKLLMKAGADLESATPPASVTPLHQAARYGHSEVVSMLLEAWGGSRQPSWTGCDTNGGRKPGHDKAGEGRRGTGSGEL